MVEEEWEIICNTLSASVTIFIQIPVREPRTTTITAPIGMKNGEYDVMSRKGKRTRLGIQYFTARERRTKNPPFPGEGTPEYLSNTVNSSIIPET